MAVSIEVLLENLEEVLEEGMGLPLSGGKRMVDVDSARDIIDDIRRNLPNEIAQAKAIVENKNIIMTKANTDAENIVKTAEERARTMVSREEIVRLAEAKARITIDEAEQKAMQIRTTITKFCDKMLADSQEQMQKSFDEMKLIREQLKK